MCGKFTQMYSWRDLHAQLSSFTAVPDDKTETVTPMRLASVIRLNASGTREAIQMRWGFSKRGAASPGTRPDHIHARSETIDTRPTFREAFQERRGLLIVRTFNEGKELTPTKTEQHTITPNDGRPLAIAVLWEAWEHDSGNQLLAFVMVTTTPNALIGTITDRMPAIIKPDDWDAWLGETPKTDEELKAMLVPFEGDWTMQPEKPAKPQRPERVQGSLF